jgi:excisionase family DNA binding protein
MGAQLPTLDEIRAVIREELDARERRAAPDVLSTEQAAGLAGVSAKTVRAWIAAGDLAAGHRGPRRTIRRADLERFLAGEASNERDATEAAARRLTGTG